MTTEQYNSMQVPLWLSLCILPFSILWIVGLVISSGVVLLAITSWKSVVGFLK